MALASRGSRHIAVDGLVFRWLVRRRPTHCQALGWSRWRSLPNSPMDRGHGWWSLTDSIGSVLTSEVIDVVCCGRRGSRHG
jgi:hypothetical protein